MFEWILQLFRRDCEEKSVSHTLTHQDFLKLQVEHILRHKYFLSEKAGHDIGIAETMKDWEKNGWAEMFRRNFRVIDEEGNTISGQPKLVKGAN